MCKLHQKRTMLGSLLLTATLMAVGPVSALEIEMPMEQEASGNYYVSGRLDDLVDTRMLFDTGSGYVSLSKTTFDQVKSDSTVFSRNIHGRMANGSTVSVPVYTISELNLSGCVIKNVEVVVFPGADRDILGLSALRQLQPFTVQLDPPMLSASC